MKARLALFRKAGKMLQKAAPTASTCAGTADVAATAVLAVRAIPKALKCIEWEKGAKSVENGGNLTRMKTTRACWRYYVPTVVTGTATIGCTSGANVSNRRQQAPLVSVCALASRSLNRYKQRVKEFCGEEAHRKVMFALAVEQSEKRPIYVGTFAAVASLGFRGADEEERLSYDTISSRYFQATISQVPQAEYRLNRNSALSGGFITLDDFYDFLGISKTPEGDKIGWMISDRLYWVDSDHQRAAVDDGLNGEVECWIIDAPFPPVTYEEWEDMGI